MAEDRYVIRCVVCGRKVGWDTVPDQGDVVCDKCEDD